MPSHYLYERGLPDDYWLLEWDELRFVLKDPAGELVIRADTHEAHRLLGLDELYGKGIVGLVTPLGSRALLSNRDAVSDLRALVEAGLRSDAEHRRRLERAAQQTMLLGLALFLASCGLFALLHGWLSSAGWPIRWLCDLLFILAGVVGLYVVFRGARRWMRVRRFGRGVEAGRAASGHP
jgi:hypothetical protein